MSDNLLNLPNNLEDLSCAYNQIKKINFLPPKIKQ